MRIEADGIRDWRPLLERLRQVPHVTAAAPGLYGQVLISRGARSGGALIKGIVPADERTVSDLLQGLKQGSAVALEPEAPARNMLLKSTHKDHTQGELVFAPMPPIVIGNDLAETIGAKVGDTVLVTSPQGELTPLGLVPRYQRFDVAGIFKSGFYQYDSSYAFTRLTDAQRLFSEPDLISVISFKVDDLYRAAEVARAIEAEAGNGFQATSWMEQNRELFRALKLEQIVTFIVLALIVCVAALNILIALTMMVMEKTRDIAVLMSFGVREDQIRRIFLLQGLLISIIGTALGLVLGYALSWIGGHYRFIHLDAAVYSIDYLPFAPRLRDALIVSAVSLGVSLIATLYPSGSAAKVMPAEALRYE
jgi:lipoprotein-releasing system permease protein